MLEAALAWAETGEGVDIDRGSLLTDWVATNRDLLDYRFLYTLTGHKMRAANSGDGRRAERLDACRGKIVQQTQAFDAPLFTAVGEAEARLGALLAQYMQGSAPPAEEVVAAAGTSAPDVFSFWLVIMAAIAAWESKLGVASVEGQARAKLRLHYYYSMTNSCRGA